MLSALLNVTGEVTGYIVEDIYLPVDQARMFFDTSQIESLTYSKVHGNFRTASSNGLVHRIRYINQRSYNDFVTACELNSLQLYDVVFVPCKATDFDWWGKNPIWVTDGAFCYKCMKARNTLGYLLLDSDLYSAKSVCIYMIEMIQKGRGDGSRVIGRLKSQGIKLTGFSVVEAERFWLKHGAVFQELNKFTI